MSFDRNAIAPKDAWGKILWNIEHPGKIPQKEKVSPDRYVFIHSLKFEDLPDDATTEDKITHIVTGILRHIPVVSLAVEAPRLYESIKNRILYEIDNEKNYVYDVRFSAWSIAKSIIYALGLGILITPVRVAAEFMRLEDEGKESFSNPHLLNKDDWEWAIWGVRGSDIDKISSYFPENPEFCSQVMFRNHHLYPELLFNTLYDSQIDDKETLSCIEKFKILRNTNPEFKSLLLRKPYDLEEVADRMKKNLIPRDEVMKTLMDMPVKNKE